MSNLLEGKVFVKISELDATTTFDTNDEFVLVRNGTTVKTAGIDFVDTVVTIGNLATKTYTDAAVAALVAGAPGALDTLNELSAALNNDADFASTVTNQLSLKLDVGDFGLYFWNELTAVTTYHIAEGTNLYYTEDRVDANFATKNTDALVEGTTNLYHTDARVLDIVNPLIPTSVFDLDIPAISVSIPGFLYYDGTSLSWQTVNAFSTTDDLAEGTTNLYYTDTRVLDIVGPLIPASTDDLSEGSNLFFTTSRARNAISASTGITYNSSTGAIGLTSTPTFTTVTTTNLNVQNVTFTGTGAVTITSGNDLNFVAAGQISVNNNPLVASATTDTTNASNITSGTLPNARLSAVPNSALANSSVTINGTTISLGGTGSITTTAISEGTNLYYTDARSRASISVSGSLSYNSSTGVISYTAPTLAAVATTGSYTDLINVNGDNGPTRIAIGVATGYTGGSNSISIGTAAGTSSSQGNRIAIGYYTGNTNQSQYATSIGYSAGQDNQGAYSVAIGSQVGQTNQGTNSVAIGHRTGTDTQGYESVAIGNIAGETNQGIRAIAIGLNAGRISQGDYAIAIGSEAGEVSQPNNTIILNASGVAINGEGESFRFYVAPIRDTTATSKGVFYNTTTKEVTTATLATVATTGSYNDLIDKPTVNYVQTVGNPVTVPYGSSLPFTIISGTITTTGNPVRIHISGDCYSNTGGNPKIQIYRDTSGLGRRMTITNNGSAIPYAIEVIDPVAAGTYTYSLKISSGSIGNGSYFGQDDGNVLTIIELK